MKELIQKIALQLREAEENKTPCDPIREVIGVENIDLAYAIQDLNTQKRIRSGARKIGAKIGLTSPVVQKQLGVNQPDFGILWDDKEILNGGSLSVNEILQPKAEAEIAFVLGRDLNLHNITSVDVISAIDYALPAIEIVGSRIKNWDIKITDTIADNASASHWVVGHTPTKINEFDLIKCQMKMLNNGKVVSSGEGKSCLGSPINATKWLANKMMSVGKPLRAGDLIFTGALGPMVNVNAGDNFHVEIEGLGSVSVSFTS